MLGIGLGAGGAAGRRRAPFAYDPTDVAARSLFDDSSADLFAPASTADLTSQTGAANGTELFNGRGTVKLTSTGAQVNLMRNMGSAADYSGVEYFDLYCHVDSPANLLSLQFRFATDAAFANAYNFNVTADAKRVMTAGWRWVRVHRSRATVQAGAPSWSAIQYVRVLATAAAATTVVVHVALVRRAEQSRGQFWLYVDDALVGAHTYGLPLFKQYGLVGALGVITSRTNDTATYPGYMSWAQVAEWAAAGWDVVSHTHTHQDLSTLTALQVADEFAQAKALLQAHGYAGECVVAPFGGWSDSVETAAASAAKVARTYGNAANPPTQAFPPLHPRVQFYRSPLNTDSAATVTGWIDGAIATGQEVALAFHDVANVASGAAAGTYEYAKPDLETVCAYVRAKIDAGQLVQRTPSGVWGVA